MTKVQSLETYLDKLEHPMKEGIALVCRQFSDAGMAASVRWGGPSFEYGRPFATLNPRLKDCIAVIFHEGDVLLKQFPALEAGTKGKAFLKLGSDQEADEKADMLSSVARAWIGQIDREGARP